MIEHFVCPLCGKKTKVLWTENEETRNLACIHCAGVEFGVDSETGIPLEPIYYGGRFIVTKGTGEQ